jgi:hypothetical protein
MRRSDGRGARPGNPRWARARVRLEAALAHFGPQAFLWITIEDLLREDSIDGFHDDRAESVSAGQPRAR